MSDTEQPVTETTVPEAAWPENGGEWSDGEAEAMEESTLLQEMTEEDESIDFYNDETFGADAEMEGGDILGRSIEDDTQAVVKMAPAPPSSSPPPPSPPSPSPTPQLVPPRAQPFSGPVPRAQPFSGPVPRAQPFSGPVPRVQPFSGPVPRTQPFSPTGVPWVRGRDRGGRRAGRGQIFEDPAVVKSIKVRPSLKSLDSAIVDCSRTSYWEQENSNSWVLPSQGLRGQATKPILQQDEAILRVIDRPAYAPRLPTYTDFMSKPPPFLTPSYRGRRGLVRESTLIRPLTQSWYSQMHPLVPRTQLRPRQLLNPRQQFNQPRLTPPQPMTPKMAQPRFGPLSPRPAPLYSPSANTIQRFRFPGSVTQLHPQHKRLLSQRPSKPHRKPERWDPYAQLMSDKEKEWIIRLQMIQLQSENPHLDDYYYQEYYKRMETKLAEEEKRGDRAKKETPKLTTPYVTKTESYTPVVHIKGSLGQVAVSTCFSPRRAIDTVRAHSPDEEIKDARHPRLEVHIEKLFNMLLEVEEASRKKGFIRGEEKEALREDMEKKVEQIYSQIRHVNPQESSDEFLPCLLVSKGKRLLARLLPFLSHDAALHALTMVTTHLPMLMSKDTDEALPVLYPPLRDVVSALSFSQLVGVLKEFTVLVPEANEMILTLACQNEFGLSLLYVLLSQGERLLSSNVPMEPNIGDFETWTDTIFQVAQQLSQASLVEPIFLPSNLLTLFCRYLDKRTVHQLKSNIESASGYQAVVS